MSNTKTFTRSFAGGELSAAMFGRIDDAKYQSGAAVLRNFIATPQGPAENRPGFAYVNATKNNGVARLIPFVYSSTQTMVLEFGEQYVRFHTQGETLEVSAGVPYEVSTPYLAADLFNIHYVQSADVMTLVHPSYPPMELRRLGALNWMLSVISFGAAVDTPTGVAVMPSPGYLARIASIDTASPATITTVASHTLALGDGIYISGLVVVIGGTTTDLSGFYLVNKVPIDGDGNLIPNQLQVMDYDGNLLDSSGWDSVTTYGTIQYGDKIFDINSHYAVAALAADNISQSVLSATVSALDNLDVPGSFNVITWDAVTGASAYYVFKQKNGLWGFIGQAVGTTFTDNNIAPDFSITPVNLDNPFSGADNYPAAVGYIEQRRCFAGTNNAPQTLWMTNSGTESTFAYSLPSEDTDRISVKVAAREVSSILHIVPLTQLVLLTGSCEYAEFTANGGPITPSSIGIRAQSYIGASTVQPSVINSSLVYCAARGGHVREMGYSWQANGFVTGDLSLRSANLFDLGTIVDQAFSKAPLPIVWFVSSNGDLLGLTYVPEQQIGAWHHHDTDGAFESICCVAEGSEERLYAVIRRTVNGQTVRYVERMASRLVGALQDCFFVDAGATFETQMATPGIGHITIQDNEATVFLSTAPVIPVGTPVTLSALTSVPGLNGETVIVTLSTPGTFVFTYTHADFDGSETGQASYKPTVTTISSLTWLEGETVAVLADGAVQNQKVVVDGTITLDHKASVVQVGLPYTADLQTLPPTLQVDGFGQGRQLNVNKVWIRLFQSSGIFAGPSADLLTEYKQRTTEVYGAPPDLQSGQAEITLMPQWNDNGQILLRQENPLPLMVVAVTMEMAIGG